VRRAVHPHPREALRAQLFEQLRVLPLASGDERRKHHQARLRGQGEQLVHHLRHGLRLERDPVLGAVGRADARVEQPQVIVDLGDGADGRARVVARGLLLDGDRGRQPLDQVDVGFFHELEELARVGRERLDVAALALGVERVEGERGFARARQARDHHQLLARQIEAEILQVVRARAADADQVQEKRRPESETCYYSLFPLPHSSLPCFRTG
jgi:hypothetical protein